MKLATILAISLPLIHAFNTCPAGTFDSVAGTGNVATCTACWPGTYSDDDATTCTPCPVGSYNPNPSGAGLKSCLPCPVDTFANTVGTDSCTPCWLDSSTLSQSGQTTCIAATTTKQTIQPTGELIKESS